MYQKTSLQEVSGFCKNEVKSSGTNASTSKNEAGKSQSEDQKLPSRRSEPCIRLEPCPPAPAHPTEPLWTMGPTPGIVFDNSSVGTTNRQSSSLQVPNNNQRRRHSNTWQPDSMCLMVPESHKQSTLPEFLPLNKSKSRSASCLRLSREDLDSLRHLDIEDDRLTIADIHKDLQTEYEKEKHFQAGFRQIKRNGSASSSSLMYLNPLVALKTSASSGTKTQEYLPLSGLEMKERWRVEQSGSGTGEIRSIHGICFTASGHVAVTEPKNSRVQLFTVGEGQSLKILKAASAVRRMQPAGICQVPQKPLLAVADLNRIVYLDPTFKGPWSTEILIKDRTNLTGLAFSTRGSLILTDTGVKPSVGLFELDGKVIREFQPDFRKPLGVTISEELGIIFVSDAELGCVYLFDQDGRLLSKLGHAEDNRVRLIYPHGLCCLARGTCLLVVDRAMHRLLVYDVRTGAVDHLLTEDDGIFSPTCLASCGDKYLTLAEENEDFKINNYKLKLFRMSKTNAKR